MTDSRRDSTTSGKLPGPPSEGGPDADLSTPERLAALKITQTDCRQCGTVIAGLGGRYACPLCGWANAWEDGDGAQEG